MKKEDETANEVDDMLPEYDFSDGVRGKYYRPGKTIIRMTIDEDVARYFYSSELLNDALRKLIADARPNRGMSNHGDDEPTEPEDDEALEPEDEETIHFDWSKAVRGLHYIPREKGSAILDEDVYGIFRTSEEVNNALRMLIKENRIPHFLSDEEWYAKHKKSRQN